MFAPEEYIGFEQMSKFVRDWSYRVYLAHLLEDADKDLAIAFAAIEDPYWLLTRYRIKQLEKADPEYLTVLKSEHWDSHTKQTWEDQFVTTVIFHCILSKVLMQLEPLLCAPTGELIRPDNYVFLHQDRLDWVYPTWPIRRSSELRKIFEYFDKGGFDGGSLADRYCFLDFGLGVLRMKNNSINGFVRCSHFANDEFSERYIETHVRPFLSRSVVWNSESLPKNFVDFFESIGAIEERWGVSLLLENETETANPKAKRGAKPTGARAEFFRRYPSGKPHDLSADAVAAELTEAGFPISGRQILNYSKELKPE